MVIERFGGPEEFRAATRDVPPLAPDGVRIKVAAAGVNPVDTKLRRGAQAHSFPYMFPLVLGWDASGTVEEVGPGVVTLGAGDQVLAYCHQDFVGHGAYAESVCVPARQVAKRGQLDELHGGALPLAGLTAYQCLHEGLQIAEGETVVVRGASGGVGSLAVQIAKAQRAHVIALASGRSEQFVRDLGADEFVDYGDGDALAAIRSAYPNGVDAVLDLVGGEELDEFAMVVHRGGRVASVLEPIDAERWADRGIRGRYVYVRPDEDQLKRLVELHAEGLLRVPVAEAFELEEVAEAHRRLESGGVHGKLVLRVDG